MPGIEQFTRERQYPAQRDTVNSGVVHARLQMAAF